MNFRNQKTSRDCFPACFSNAMLHFDITVSPALSGRLYVFNNGTENCTIYSSEERLEQYERSIHKFISEWNWMTGHEDEIDSTVPTATEWAKDLLRVGICLEFKNGPIEQRKTIWEALAKGKLVISEVWRPSEGIPNSECKHFILIVTLADEKLLVHDPLPIGAIQNHNMVKHNSNNCGSNLEVDSDYFFSDEIGPMKPKPNQYQTDWGYKFILVSKLANILK